MMPGCLEERWALIKTLKSVNGYLDHVVVTFVAL